MDRDKTIELAKKYFAENQTEGGNGWATMADFAIEQTTALRAENAEMKQLMDESRTPLEIMELLASQQLRTSQVDAENSSLREQVRVLSEAAKELADLMDGVREGDYTPDSFTNQPINAALAKVENALTTPTNAETTNDN